MIKEILKKVLKLLLAMLLILSLLPYAMGNVSTLNMEENMLYDNSEFKIIHNVNIHFREWLPQNQYSGNVLLVHGLGGSTFSYRYTAERLANEGYYVIAVDLPGFGFSERVEDFDHSQQSRAKILWDLLDEIHMSSYDSKSWHLVGHSMGGGTVTAMSIDKPEKVSSLTLANGALFNTNPQFAKYLIKYPPIKRWANLILNRMYFSEEKIDEILTSAYGRAPLDFELEAYLLPLMLEGTVNTLFDIISTSSNIEKEDFASLQVPLYAIWGEEDSWVDINRMYELKSINPNLQTYVIRGAGHCPMETHPNEFNIMIMEVLINN